MSFYILSFANSSAEKLKSLRDRRAQPATAADYFVQDSTSDGKSSGRITFKRCALANRLHIRRTEQGDTT
ncbi:hypothetical protein N7516_005601 [Penicillium verrucosum]|uniref:uncharacterized protein n=1 Tax=Penicillium verrucosum TaxID=60171 RepID=UPI002545A8BE|nr:uncharacterized protein N7516_005601 [Penicillium verrucosum]KAJ5945433.1 hypothetical protein N7516_005601 [Penicillium verrucosum]